MSTELSWEAEAKRLFEATPNDGTPKWLHWRILTLISHIRSLRECLERKDEALRFYANHETWESTSHESTFDGMPCSDFQSFKYALSAPYQVAGKKAREALALKPKELE